MLKPVVVVVEFNDGAYCYYVGCTCANSPNELLAAASKLRH